MTSAVDWLMSKFGTNFDRNSKFHIRMTILFQLRDSVTPAIANATELTFKGGLGTVRGVSTTAGVFWCICFAVFVWTIKLDWFTYYRSFQRTHSQNKRQNTWFFALLLHIFHQMYAFLLTKYFYCLNALIIK